MEININDLASNPEKGIKDLAQSLMYGSYKANRDGGLTHEQLVRIGIGNDKLLAIYNAEKGLN